jgi:predicted glycogen debranching enzyme
MPLDDFRLSWEAGVDPAHLRHREWLVANGLGGYASGTVAGGVSRRFHGVFIPNLPAPRGRTMMIPYLEAQVGVNGHRAVLNDIELEGDRFEGEATEYLREFHLEGQVPVWTFEVDGRRIQRRVLMVNEQNTVCVTWTLMAGDPVQLLLRPHFTFRGHADIGGPELTPSLTVTGKRFELKLADDAPPLRLAMHAEGSRFIVSQCRREGIFLRIEHDRGYDFLDHWTSPGYFEQELAVGRPVSFVASTQDWPALAIDPVTVFDAERRRCERLISLARENLRTGPTAQLLLAADQFLIFPGSRLEEAVMAHAEGGEARTVIAGYHWFTDWGRDTMISLEGLTLVAGRPREARWILKTFAHYIRDGLIPNNFPEGERTGVYHTVDATLWYFHALDRYFDTTEDRDTLAFLFEILSGVVERHVAGTGFGIHVDPSDGLLAAGAEGYQLTWMDAKVEDWVVTPRRGKPVEIQALWYNALRLMARWAKLLGRDQGTFDQRAEQAFQSFNRRFWIEKDHYLYDVVDGPGGDDPTFRPNQVFSLALRFPVLDESRWRPVVNGVTAKLLTPVGLRTLSPDHRDYKKMYWGDLRARDAAYHQGTVWPWLIGPYVNAYLRAFGEKPPARILDGLLAHLRDAGIGTISEIFDAEQPYHPRGCMAQAWSVAEVLRVLALLK